MTFSWKDGEKLKENCAKELRKHGHRSMRYKSKRQSKKIVKWQDVSEKKVKEIGHKNYEEWSRKNKSYNEESELIEPLVANPDQLSYDEE